MFALLNRYFSKLWNPRDIGNCAKSRDWESMDFAGKVRWRCTHPDPGVDYGTLADKYRVKAVVRSHFPVAECYKVVRSAREIDQAELPSTFVMKGTHRWNRAMLAVDGRFQGQNRSRTMCGRPVSNLRMRWLARKWLMRYSREWFTELHYRFVEPGILFEELIDPVDYELQLFLFYGVCRMTMVVKRGFNHQNGIRYRLYDGNWHKLEPGSKESEPFYDNSPPETLRPGQEVFRVLEQVCKHIDHVRADFFSSHGTLYFNEFTFTHNAGRPSLLGRYERELAAYWPA